MVFKKFGRYSVPSDEDFQEGSDGDVIKNYLEITSKAIMDEVEQNELKRTEMELIKIYNKDKQFTADDICNMHELWLGDIYPMAGKYRTVSMEKDGFRFASSSQIEKLMGILESKYLKKFTPCHYADTCELAFALGVVHVELILIHPFREGNGRVARLLADLMAIQANMPPLNYQLIDITEKPQGFNEYIKAIHAGLDENYLPIQNIFATLLQFSV